MNPNEAITRVVKLAGKKQRGTGRPRSETTRKAILQAALSLIQESSVQAITIEAIAKEAGVSKATIYRWWDSKASVVIDAFIEDHIVHTPMRHDLSPTEAIVHHWRALAEQYSGMAGRIVAQILAECQSSPAVHREFRERFFYGRRAVVQESFNALHRAFPETEWLENEYLMEMLYASVYSRLIWGYPAIDRKFIAEYPIVVFKAIGIDVDGDGKVIAKP